MNAEQLYEEFKLILDQLGVGFRGKDQVEVKGHLTFTLNEGGKKITVELDLGGNSEAT